MIDLTQFEGHTPGPLSVSDEEGGIVFVGKDDKDICLLFTEDNYPHIMADARLFAAAPDLLAEVMELRGLLAEFEDYLIESLNNVVPDSRPRYQAQRDQINADLARLRAAIGGE